MCNIFCEACKAFLQTLTNRNKGNKNELNDNSNKILQNNNNVACNPVFISGSNKLDEYITKQLNDNAKQYSTNYNIKLPNQLRPNELYERYPILQTILLIHNSNALGLCSNIQSDYNDKHLCKICEELFEANKNFYSQYKDSDQEYYILTFNTAWRKVYQYYLLNNKITEFKKTRIELESIEEELNNLKIYIKFSFNDNDYINAHNNFVNDNLQFVLDNYSYNSKIIAQWLINNRSLIKYIPNVYLHIYNIPENISDYPFLHIRNYYNSYYYELLQIYLSNNDINNDTSYKQLLSDNINKLFNAIKQHTTSDKYTDEERKIIDYYYNNTRKLQEVLDELGITCNNEIAKAS